MLLYQPNPAWLITTYNQTVQTVENIHRIRKYETFEKQPIIVVYTYPRKDIFDAFLPELDSNVLFIHFEDAPGNPVPWYMPWKKFKTKSPAGSNWRDNYIAARILLSMRLGFIKADQIGCNLAIHLHSDTYWETNRVGQLKGICEKMLTQGKVLYGDQPIVFEKEDILPPNFHFHPEGTIFNLQTAKYLGYGFNFDEIYKSRNSSGLENLKYKEDFWTPHFGRTEALFPSWLHWTIAKTNITSPNSKVDKEYYYKIMTGISRSAHGVHPNGLINFGQQQDQ